MPQDIIIVYYRSVCAQVSYYFGEALPNNPLRCGDETLDMRRPPPPSSRSRSHHRATTRSRERRRRRRSTDRRRHSSERRIRKRTLSEDSYGRSRKRRQRRRSDSGYSRSRSRSPSVVELRTSTPAHTVTLSSSSEREGRQWKRRKRDQDRRDSFSGHADNEASDRSYGSTQQQYTEEQRDASREPGNEYRPHQMKSVEQLVAQIESARERLLRERVQLQLTMLRNNNAPAECSTSTTYSSAQVSSVLPCSTAPMLPFSHQTPSAGTMIHPRLPLNLNYPSVPLMSSAHQSPFFLVTTGPSTSTAAPAAMSAGSLLTSAGSLLTTALLQSLIKNEPMTALEQQLTVGGTAAASSTAPQLLQHQQPESVIAGKKEEPATVIDIGDNETGNDFDQPATSVAPAKIGRKTLIPELPPPRGLPFVTPELNSDAIFKRSLSTSAYLNRDRSYHGASGGAKENQKRRRSLRDTMLEVEANREKLRVQMENERKLRVEQEIAENERLMKERENRESRRLSAPGAITRRSSSRYSNVSALQLLRDSMMEPTRPGFDTTGK